MANIRFNLDIKNNKGYLFLIYYCSSPDRLKYSLREKIPPKDWDSKKGRAKPVNPAATSINTLLSELILFIDRTRHEYKVKGERLTSSALRTALDKRLYGDDLMLFHPYAVQWLQNKNITSATAKSYRNMITKVDKLFPFMTFDQVNSKWRDQIVKSMAENKQNYTHTILKRFKEVMASAYIDNIHQNKYFMNRSFVMATEKVENIYLTMDQINYIYNHLDQLTDSHRNAMIPFLIGCLTGQRYQTFTKLDKTMIVLKNDIKMISIITEKTKQRVTIPVSDKLESLLNMEYKPITNQKLNEYIKAAAKSLNLPNYEQIKTHTARRSFATNAVLAGIDISLIMKITGHTTEKEFRKYVKMDDILAAEKSSGMIRIMQDK